MKFNYSLQKIVDVKTNEKRQAEWVLSDAIGELNKKRGDLVNLEHEKNQLQENMAIPNNVSVATLSNMAHYVSHLDTLISRKASEVHEAKKNVDEHQEHLHTKVKEEKVWCKAKEKAYSEFSVKVLKMEQNTIDEMACARFNRSFL